MSSKAMVFGSETALSVVHFIKFSITIALKIEANFKALFPEYYELYKEAFDASVFYSDDPGPFLGRAVVWKLPVKCHVDDLDAGPCVIYNMGYYTGGKLLLPDLKLKFVYASDLFCSA